MEASQKNEVEINTDKNSNKLWEIADIFRDLVCNELRNLEPYERISLKGDYLFKIDSLPRFIVMVDEEASWSVSIELSNRNTEFKFVTDFGCPWNVTDENLMNVIEGSSRTTILTDSVTLYKILTGNLKAHKAFITGKVTIAGDLAAFLKMVSLLKKGGVKSKYESTFQT
ncbi:SCP2 sterol-binding domain-containing protein [Pigmentibacter sp. JX0631]|uniref:SCP2 sterol-binding domain-containing protein n=1 Tax=Pigmentibacter sp. JX0631 TaxID=2976982 RepID=UPI002468FC41|nr:SCP2 sterol-binding domain-containing protein [Pigmentibacter sp. JX0631]WGL59652.1 SCP2 sterol-binding domain-containing protein [Pigmentibacter sp. JX0631]